MSEPRDASRRHFLKLCGSASAALACPSSPLLAADNEPQQRFARTLLVDEEGAPLRCDQLQADEDYIFHYPYRSTPCFLIDLGKTLAGGDRLQTEQGRNYRWRGGVGPERSVVSFSAICAHKLTHPSPVVSFIGYRSQPVGFVNREEQVERRAGVIQCCSEHSVYDPARGAAVIAGPAPQPLAAIELDFKDGALYATGVYGGDLFGRYFESFGDRLELEYGGDGYAELVTETTTVVAAAQYTRNRISCG